MSDAARGQMTGLLSPLLERMRVRRAARLIRDGESVLDVGCGRAALLTTLLDSGKRGVRYYGIDRLADCISTHQQHYPDHRFHEADISQAADLGVGERFDVIAMLAVIEHLPNPQAALRRVAKLLSGRGRLLITTPCRGNRETARLGSTDRFLRPRSERRTR